MGPPGPPGPPGAPRGPPGAPRGPPGFSGPPSNVSPHRVIPKRKMKALHWDKLKKTQIKGTIFEELNKDNTVINTDLFEKHFEQKKKKTKKGNKGKKASKEMKFLEGKKAQNIERVLSFFKTTNEVIRDGIVTCHQEIMTPSNVDNFLNFMMPDDEIEIKISKCIKETGDKDGVSFRTMERWFFLILKAFTKDEFSKRIECYKFYFSVKEDLEKINICLEIFSKCLSTIMNSKGLRDLMRVTLRCGNHLNGGKKKGDASGFKISTLSRISTMTSRIVDKFFLIDFICQTAAESAELNEDYPYPIENLRAFLRYDALYPENMFPDIIKNMKLVDECLELFPEGKINPGSQMEDQFYIYIIPFAEEIKNRFETTLNKCTKLKKDYSDLLAWFKIKEMEKKDFFTLFFDFHNEIQLSIARLKILETKKIKEEEEQKKRKVQRKPVTKSIKITNIKNDEKPIQETIDIELSDKPPMDVPKFVPKLTFTRTRTFNHINFK